MKKVVQYVVTAGRGWNGDSMGDVLGVSPSRATMEDVKKLGWLQVMQLFHAAIEPAFDELKGEYKAEVLDVGPLAPVAAYISHNVFGPGKWIGKAFRPQKNNRGWGHNLFQGKNGAPARVRKMNFSISESNIDARKSIHLDYGVHNKGFIGTMHDEIRKINDSLYIGLGYMKAGGGPFNPAPFVIYGEATEWVGPD